RSPRAAVPFREQSSWQTDWQPRFWTTTVRDCRRDQRRQARRIGYGSETRGIPSIAAGMFLHADNRRSQPPCAPRNLRYHADGCIQRWPKLAAYNPRTLDHLVSTSIAPRRFALLLMGLFAGLALVLALVGIYGVLSWAVNERTREIGIRLAIGAQRRDVLGMMLKRGMRWVAVGGLIGLIGACALTRILRGLLYEVSPTDPFTLVAVTLLIACVAVLTCYL